MPPEIKSLRWRRFVAKYVTYLEILAYALVFIVGTALIVAWTYEVDVTADSKDGTLNAHEHVIKLDSECVVIRLPVADKTDVKRGDLVAEVCTDPDFVKRYRAMEGVRKALDGLKGMATSPTAAPLIERFESDLAAWDEAEKPAYQAVTATATGTLWLGACTTGTAYAAEKKMFGIRDFNVLEVTLTFEAANAFACRPGLSGYIEVNAEQADESLVRLSTDDVPWVPFVGSRLSQFTAVADEEIREVVSKAVKGRLLLDRDKAKTDDFPLPAKDLKEIVVRVSADPIEGDPPTGKATTTTALRSHDFRAAEVDAVCIKGKHQADVTLFDVDVGAAATKYVKPEVEEPEEDEAGTDDPGSAAEPDARPPMEQIRDLVHKGLFNRTILSGEARLHVTGELEGMVVNVKLAAELQEEEWDLDLHPKGYALEDLPDVGERSADDGTKQVKFTKRKFVGTLRLVEPDPHLCEEVKQLALKGKGLKVKGKLIVRRTPFAMMLFRKH